ncbi:hypothetical protein ACRYCC_15430 [Actinomadura scrupuli]|uniref:hypothetical protein n=1 Tax=Actinomadura scrupuli TaxID=559629 RepID=UPI003D97CC4C
MHTGTQISRQERPGRRAQRAWQLTFTAFCLVAVVLAWGRGDSPHPAIRTAAGIAYVPAALLVLLCVTALGRSRCATRARTTLIVFHFVFVPLQFFFFFGGGPEQLAGMALSAVIVALMRPRFPQLRRRTRKVWLTLHVGVSVGWLGLSLAMAALAIAGAVIGDHPVRHGAYELMHVFDLTIVIPSVVLTLVSGLVLSLGTPWGLIRHRWVLLKLVISLIIPITATVQKTWIEQLQERTRDPAGETGGVGLALTVTTICYMLLLWTAVVLSIYKPGGRTRWGRPSGRTKRAATGGDHGDPDAQPHPPAAVHR